MAIQDHPPSDPRFEREILQDISAIKSDVSGLGRDITNLRYLYERLETNFIKLDSATGKIDTLLSIQEKTLINIERMLRERDDKQAKDIDEIKKHINERFTREESDRRADSIASATRINDLATNHIKASEKISALERFRWIVYGALVIIAFAAPYVEKLIRAVGAS